MTAIYVVDRIARLSGRAQEILEAYMRDYAPGARSRGMMLEHTLMHPPVLLRAGARNRLTFIWSLADLDAWWRMRMSASGDPAVTAFWQGISPLIAGHERSFHKDADI
jgi:hypothetical protein